MMGEIYLIFTNDGGYYGEDQILSIYDADKNKDISSPFFTSKETAQDYLDKLFEAPESLNVNFPVEKEDCWIESLEPDTAHNKNHNTEHKFLYEWRKKAVLLYWNIRGK